jgi:hypothetical protein
MSMIKADGSSQPVSHQFAKNGLGNIQNINWTSHCIDLVKIKFHNEHTILNSNEGVMISAGDLHLKNGSELTREAIPVFLV